MAARGDRTEPTFTMNFPPTFQDEFYFSAGYASLVTGPSEGTQELWYPSGYPGSAHYEPGESFYEEAYAFASHVPVGHPSSMVLAASAHTAMADVGAGQPAPSSVYAPSNNAQNISMNPPIMAAVTPASNVAPLAQATNQRRVQCPMCPNTFDRFTRAEACHNNHLGWKPHVCKGACGNMACNTAYGSIENLHRHVRTPAQRKVACPRCSRSFLKQNISRHKKSCV